ncbi:MAG TPA: tagaturonate epimerase family protein [Lacipirellulaceae bacterium]|nr:tagaturonate epimerase family protein [Lacipirellulaceae bacterium]
MSTATKTKQFATLGLTPSFGFGDRIGLATPGHIEAMKRTGGGFAPIFAQQSIREMSRTGRTPSDVVDAALWGMEEGEWRGVSGADADHLKTRADVDVTAAAGFTFFTIDPSDYVDGNADDYDEATLRERFAQIQGTVPWFSRYLNQRTTLPSGRSFTIDEQAAMRCAIKYGRALDHAIELASYIRDVSDSAGRPFELELSIDETRQPTSLAEHYIIADQFRQHGLQLISIAPKFIGEFEKGVDYKGDLSALERSLDDHAALARELGPYKLSLHSGSDKLSLYPILARTTNGCLHVKTAGTSYLEALRVVARHDESLFRRVVEVARQHYDRDKATYHVSAAVDRLPGPDDVRNVVELEMIYLERWSEVPAGRGFTAPGRQVLHCTFGTILMDAELGGLIRQLLETHTETYTEILADHFERHLRALNATVDS